MTPNFESTGLAGLEKLALVTTVKPREPVGVRFAFGEHGCIWLGFTTLMFALCAGAISGFVTSGEPIFSVAAGLTGLIGLVCVYVSKIRFGAPTSPERAMRNFYEFISRGNYKAAWDMLVPLEHNKESGEFESFDAFRAYWKRTRKELKLRSGKLFFQEVQVTPGPSGVAICSLKIQAAADMIIAPALIATATVSLGADREYQIQKLVVPFGAEWRIWSGEFVGADEHDLSWLPTEGIH